MVDTQGLKEELGVRAKDIIANGLGLIEKQKMVLCPLHNDTKPSMSWYEQGLNWNCHACGGNIDIFRYYTEFEQMSFVQAVEEVEEMLGKTVAPVKTKPKGYVKPNIKMQELTDPFIEYMNIRGITKETLDAWNVKQHNWCGKDVYVFQYFNEKKELEYVSYRGLGKEGIKGGCEPNTKNILWGIDKIDKSKPVVITEGQPDAMVVWQSGYKNVVSVPNGANNLKWIDNCWDWLQGVNEFVIWADNDKAGLEMANKVKAKLDNVKILVSDSKDANEVLFRNGSGKVKELIDDVLNQMPDGLVDLAQIEYKSAIDREQDGIETGFFEYDYHVEDWKPQDLTIIFGRNGEGKTTFISQIIAHCIEKEQKTFLYSGEMGEDKIQDWLYRQVIGNRKENLRTVTTKYKNKTEPKPEAVLKIKEWHSEELYLFDRNEKQVLGNLDKFFEVMEVAAKRYGVKLFIIDNLMSILEENADSLYSDQSNFTQRCKYFAIDNDVHVVLLAHPNKLKQEIREGTEGNLEKTDISGSNNIGNKADNIIAVERLWGDDADCDAIITSLKDRTNGQRKQMRFFFSQKSLRFYNNETREDHVYSWEMQKETREAVPKEFQLTLDKDCPF